MGDNRPKVASLIGLLGTVFYIINDLEKKDVRGEVKKSVEGKQEVASGKWPVASEKSVISHQSSVNSRQ
jgi:hypothetical protein